MHTGRVAFEARDSEVKGVEASPPQPVGGGQHVCCEQSQVQGQVLGLHGVTSVSGRPWGHGEVARDHRNTVTYKK